MTSSSAPISGGLGSLEAFCEKYNVEYLQPGRPEDAAGYFSCSTGSLANSITLIPYGKVSTNLINHLKGRNPGAQDIRHILRTAFIDQVTDHATPPKRPILPLSNQNSLSSATKKADQLAETPGKWGGESSKSDTQSTGNDGEFLLTQDIWDQKIEDAEPSGASTVPHRNDDQASQPASVTSTHLRKDPHSRGQQNPRQRNFTSSTTSSSPAPASPNLTLSISLSVGLNVTTTFPMNSLEHSRVMCKQLPGFFSQPMLCAEFLRMIFEVKGGEDSGFKGRETAQTAWAEHALYSLRKASDLIVDPNTLERRCFGYVIIDLEVEIWEMTQLRSATPAAPRYKVQCIAKLDLTVAKELKECVDWYVQILNWASLVYCPSYMEAVDKCYSAQI
ncbi:MAG: hypothetical protein Q9201_006125 [Fulgogasparrea decipioides]